MPSKLFRTCFWPISFSASEPKLSADLRAKIIRFYFSIRSLVTFKNSNHYLLESALRSTFYKLKKYNICEKNTLEFMNKIIEESGENYSGSRSTFLRLQNTIFGFFYFLSALTRHFFQKVRRNHFDL